MNSPSVMVKFGPRNHIQVDAEALSSWFPTLSSGPFFTVDGSPLIDKLHDRLHSRYNIHSSTIRTTLCTLFDELGFHLPAFQGQTRTRITRALAKLLDADLDANRNWSANKGFHQSRHCFIILAYLANEYESILLAGALLDFWFRYQHDIMQDDQKLFFKEWQPALRKLEELGPDGMVHGSTHLGINAHALLPHGRWHRGRNPLRTAALPWTGNRALSAPVIHRRRSPDLRIGVPGFRNPAWASPMLSPVGLPRARYFDEINVLQYQQEEVNMKLDNIDRRLNYLAKGY